MEEFGAKRNREYGYTRRTLEEEKYLLQTPLEEKLWRQSPPERGAVVPTNSRKGRRNWRQMKKTVVEANTNVKESNTASTGVDYCQTYKGCRS